MAFKDRLKQARFAKGLTQEQLANAIGVAKSTVTGYEKGNSEPDMNKISKIMNTLDIDANYLWQDAMKNQTGSPVLDFSSKERGTIKKYRVLDEHGKNAVDAILDVEYKRMTHIVKTQVQHKNNITYIACYDLAVSAGTGSPMGDTPYRTRLEIPTEFVPDNAHYCVRVSGNSMEPAYSDGDIVFVQRQDECVREGEIGIFVLNGDSYVKQMGKSELISLNLNYDPITIHEFDTLICQGRVLGKV